MSDIRESKATTRRGTIRTDGDAEQRPEAGFRDGALEAVIGGYSDLLDAWNSAFLDATHDFQAGWVGQIDASLNWAESSFQRQIGMARNGLKRAEHFIERSSRSSDRIVSGAMQLGGSVPQNAARMARRFAARLEIALGERAEAPDEAAH